MPGPDEFAWFTSFVLGVDEDKGRTLRPKLAEDRQRPPRRLRMQRLLNATIGAGGDRGMARVTVELNVEQLARAIAALPQRQRQELWSLLATIEEEEDPGALEALRESEEDVKAGRTYSFEDVFGSSAA